MNSYQMNRFRNRRFKWLMKISSWISALPRKVTPAPFALMQMGSVFWQSRALYVGTKLEIADVLKNDTKNTVTIAQELQLHEDHCYRLMRMLASIGVFKEISHRVFKNTKMSNYLRKDNSQNVRAMILMHNSPEMVKPWLEPLEDCIKSGDTPFEQTHGTGLFDYMNENKAFDSLFSEAMDTVEALTENTFLNDFNWSRFNRIVDLGGSKGSKSLSILAANPEMSALVMDRPSIIDNAEKFWAGIISPQVLERIDFLGGDILEKIPDAVSDQDLFLCVAVFHALDDNACLKVLHNIKIAMNGIKATLVIADAVAEEVGIEKNVASFDMQMLIGCQGRERTLTEWNSLFEEAGFSLVELVDATTFAKFIVLQVRE